MLSKYGIKIREIRDKNNDTLEDLAKKLNMSFSTLGKYERGERKITPELLEQVAAVYDVPASYFYGVSAPVPEELKQLGVEWIAFVKEMEEKEITPEEIRAIMQVINKFQK